MKKNSQKNHGTCSSRRVSAGAAGSAFAAESLQDVMKAPQPHPAGFRWPRPRPTPMSGTDEFLAFASGGQSGQMIVHGVPSMRIPEVHRRVHSRTPAGLRYFRRRIQEGARRRQHRRQVDHLGRHPPPGDPETNGEYDGQFLFINDKSNLRLAVIDLRDFRDQADRRQPDHEVGARRRIRDPEHRAHHRGSQCAPPLENQKFYPLEQFNEKYSRRRHPLGSSTASTANRRPTSPFARAAALPQDLSDAGKLDSTTAGPSPTASVRTLRRRHREGPPAV